MRIVRLSHVNDPETTSLYPGDPAFEIETVDAEGFFLQYVRQGEHTGTHWGAPGHFEAGGALADDLDPQDFLLPAVRIDVREQCAADADYAVTVADVEAYEKNHGRMPDGSMVIIWTGWEDRWGTPAFLDPHQPGFAPETVEWLIATGRLGRTGGTGTDTFSPDRGIDRTFDVSRMVYREHRISLECLAGLAQLPPAGAQILVGGTINRRGSGSPATVWGLAP